MHTVVDMRGVALRRGERMILQGIDWTVRPGEHWALVGANGSGKTTLLRLACGYLWPSEGEIDVLGERFGAVDLRELRTRIGWVSSALSAMVHNHHPAMDIILSGPRAALGIFDPPTEADRAEAGALAERFDLAGVADSPFGVLSAGERQKVLIARALMCRPQLLILDEACAGLDLRARELLLRQIDALAAEGGLTLIFVTHHIEEISPGFTHALVLDGGRIAASGPKGDILTAETLSEALRVEMAVDRHEGRFWPRMLR